MVNNIFAATLSTYADKMPPLIDVRNRLWNSTGFFLVVWAVHYFPFYLMSRQLFIHHYLPSHLASALVAGSVLSFVLSETINAPVSIWGTSIARPRRKTYADHGVKAPIIVAIFAVAMFAMYVYIAPLTYGTPGYVLTSFVLNAQRCLPDPTDLRDTKLTADGCCQVGLCTSRRKRRRFRHGHRPV